MTHYFDFFYFRLMRYSLLIRSASIIPATEKMYLDLLSKNIHANNTFLLSHFSVSVMKSLSFILYRKPIKANSNNNLNNRKMKKTYMEKVLKSSLSILTSACRSKMSLCHFYPKLFLQYFCLMFNSLIVCLYYTDTHAYKPYILFISYTAY